MIDGIEKATLEYRWLKGRMVLMHTLVPAAYRHLGIDDELVRHALDNAMANNIKVIVYCTYAARFLENHPEYQYLTA